MAAVVTYVNAGYFGETDDVVGVAHVLEHMFFKGTHRRGPGELARETQLLGGYLNASTIYDKTVYYTVIPAADGAFASFVAERLDGVEAGGFPCGPQAEDKADADTRDQAADGRPKWDVGWEQ